MHNSTLIVLIMVVTKATACTFGMLSSYFTAAGWDGTRDMVCKFYIWDNDLDDAWEDSIAPMQEMHCSRKCSTVTLYDLHWEFCHSIVDSHGARPATSATVQQTDNNGDELSIYPNPDRKYKHKSHINPSTTYEEVRFWRKG